MMNATNANSEKTISKARFLCALLTAVLLVAVDQIVKYQAVQQLKGAPSVPLIPGVLEFMYLENHGAAFSMLQDQQWFFYILTTVFLIVAAWVLYCTPKTRRFWPLIWTVLVLCAGAVGNLIDRIVYRYVVDFIYFSLIDFPVFNIADIYVTLSVIALICLVLFRYKDEDLQAIFGKH